MQNKQKIACELQKKREIVDKVNLEMSIDGQQIAKPSVFAIFLALYAFLSIHENQFSAPKKVQQSPDLVTVDLVKNFDLVKFSLLTEFL